MGTQVLAVALIAALVVTQSVYCFEKMGLEQLRKMLSHMGEPCQNETGVSSEILAGTHQGIFPRERPLMCYFKCLSVALAVMDKEGHVHMEEVDKKLHQYIKEDLIPRIHAVGIACFTEIAPTQDVCEYAFDFVVCTYNKDKELYVLP